MCKSFLRRTCHQAVSTLLEIKSSGTGPSSESASPHHIGRTPAYSQRLSLSYFWAVRCWTRHRQESVSLNNQHVFSRVTEDVCGTTFYITHARLSQPKEMGNGRREHYLNVWLSLAACKEGKEGAAGCMTLCSACEFLFNPFARVCVYIRDRKKEGKCKYLVHLCITASVIRAQMSYNYRPGSCAAQFSLVKKEGGLYVGHGTSKYRKLKTSKPRLFPVASESL